MTDSKKVGFKDFPFTYWIVIMFEFFERGAYYGVMSILSIYMTEKLGFAKTDVGIIKSTIQPLLYFLPILSGAIADRMGYRKTLMVAFSLLGIGYFFASQTTEYSAIFIALVVMGFGAGTFKPIISGTIAKVTDERTSTLGFGVFYWSINLGAFLFPLIIVPYMKSMDWSYVLLMAAIVTSAMLIPTIFVYKEPNREINKEPLVESMKAIFHKIAIVFMDWRFILFIFIYSMFWILYFQMFDSVLWYVKDFVDATPLDHFIKNTFGINFKFDVEHVTVINAGTIILLQLLISSLVKNTKALPTMITGVTIASFGMAILAFSTSIWIFILGTFIFSIGEMVTHPKYISYLGLIAPEDKKATYMGFGFLYGVFGSLIGGIVGANLYVKFVDKPIASFVINKLKASGSTIQLAQNSSVAESLKAAETLGITREQLALHANTTELWLVFAGIGVVCILGLLLYQKVIGVRSHK